MSGPVLMPNGNLAPSQQPGEWQAAHDELKGKHPNDLGRADLAALGHIRPILAAVREFCVQCAGGSRIEADRCAQTWCPLWPFHRGTNPHTRREITGEQRAVLVERGKRLAASFPRHGREAAKDGEDVVS
jgi:hypothetical protein